MRVLMTSFPKPSHFAHMVPLAWALRASGHEVIAAAQPDLAPMVASAGLSMAQVGGHYYADDLMLRHLHDGRRLLELTDPTTPRSLQDSAKTWQMHARYVLPRYLEFARQWKPDLILSEKLEFAGPIVAKALGIPSVHHRFGVDAYTDPGLAAASDSLHMSCERLGLDGYPEASLILDPCPPELQMPGLKPGRSVRHVPFNGAGLMPSWARRGERRRVCVSLGNQTLLLNGVPLLRHVIEAFEGLDHLEVLVTAESRYLEAIGDVPHHVRIVEPTPLNLFLDSCDLLISHGGPGTMLTALGMGIPQLILPQWTGHFETGSRLAELGAGRTLENAADQDNPLLVREAVLALLEEDGYRKAAMGLADSMKSLPTPAELVPDLEALAG
ncbi:glycosyltransferase [Streptomyces sp. BK340]|nr:glycosyltransferase [Streptomyces sp. BK340]